MVILRCRADCHPFHICLVCPTVFDAFGGAVEGGEDLLADDPVGEGGPVVEGVDVLEEAQELALTGG